MKRIRPIEDTKAAPNDDAPEEDDGGLDSEDLDNLDNCIIPRVYDQYCAALFSAWTRSGMNIIGSLINSLRSNEAEEE